MNMIIYACSDNNQLRRMLQGREEYVGRGGIS